MCGAFQMRSAGLLACWQRSVMMTSALSAVQCMPDCLRCWPITTLHPASTTPDPTDRPHWRNYLQRMRGVVLEVAQGRVELVFLDALEGVGAGGVADAVDVAVAGVLEAGGEPVVLAVQRRCGPPSTTSTKWPGTRPAGATGRQVLRPEEVVAEADPAASTVATNRAVASPTASGESSWTK